MAEGQIRAIIWASCPAPDTILFTEHPDDEAVRSMRRTSSSSNETGSNLTSFFHFQLQTFSLGDTMNCCLQLLLRSTQICLIRISDIN